MMSLGGYHDASGEYHEYTEVMISTSGYLYKFNGFINNLPHINHGIP